MYMNGTEIALIIGSLAAFLTAIGGVIINARRLDELRDENKRNQTAIETNRLDLIQIGERLLETRRDNASLVLLVNQLFNQYEVATGHKPEIDWEMFDKMMTIQRITGAMGPLQVKDGQD